MALSLPEQAARVALRYLPDHTPNAVVPLQRGHINDSFRVTYREHGAIRAMLLQRINQHVFSDPEAVMNNILLVTTHAAARLRDQGRDDAERRTLSVLLARNGAPWVRWDDGSWWRAFRYVDGSTTLETPCVQSVEDAARLYGAFQAMLTNADGLKLQETIPDFHNTPMRLEALRRAAEEDPWGRRRAAETELSRMLDQATLVRRLRDLQTQGRVPVRIVHNDTKLDNILFDAATGEALCVIDLDTVMPGLALHDFGDMVRSMTTSAPEDATALESVAVREDLFAAVARGYLDAASSFLTGAELDHLVVGAQVITLETAVRFLTDHLLGDVYFRVHRRDHNLHRARCQLRLFESLVEHQDRLEAIIHVISSGGITSV